MAPPFRQIELPNGLVLQVQDHSRRYFGDYFLVRLEIRCTVTLPEQTGAEHAELAAARSLLGGEVVYRRRLERMGVPSGEVETVQNTLLDDFYATSIAYLGSPEFPSRLVSAELRRVQQRSGRAWP